MKGTPSQRGPKRLLRSRGRGVRNVDPRLLRGPNMGMLRFGVTQSQTRTSDVPTPKVHQPNSH